MGIFTQLTRETATRPDIQCSNHCGPLQVGKAILLLARIRVNKHGMLQHQMFQAKDADPQCARPTST